MKAALLRGPQQITVEEIPIPQVPEDGVLLKVAACGLCGSDLRTYLHGPRFAVDRVIMGHEIGGTVAAVGPQATGYAVGKRLAVAPDVHCGHCYYCRRGLFNRAMSSSLSARITPVALPSTWLCRVRSWRGALSIPCRKVYRLQKPPWPNRPRRY